MYNLKSSSAIIIIFDIIVSTFCLVALNSVVFYLDFFYFQLLIFELDRCETPVASFVEEPKITGEIVNRF